MGADAVRMALPAAAGWVMCAVAVHSVSFLVLEAGTFPLIKFEVAKTSLWLFCKCLKGFVSRE